MAQVLPIFDLRLIPSFSEVVFILLIDVSIVHLPRVVSLLHGHHNVVMMRQVPTQTDVLRVFVRAQVAGKSSLTAALEAYVSCQVVLQRVSFSAGNTLDGRCLIFSVAGIPRTRSNIGGLRGHRFVNFSVVDDRIFRGMEALVKI